MTAQQLKRSILQMAIQGKLVPQDPSDEPASVLLNRIREEKENLIKEGKLKREKNPSVIFRGTDNTPYEKVGNAEPVSIADEVPFEIPESWEWVRLASVFSVLNGDRGKNYPAKSTLSKTGIPFISALNLDGKTVVDDDNLLCLSEAQYERLGNGKLVKNDIVVCIRGSLGKHGRFPFDKGAIASSLVILRPQSNVAPLSDYIMMYLDTPLFFSEIKKYDNGTAQPNLAAKSLEQFFVPIPPVTEQKRILQELDILEPYIANYRNAFKELDSLNTSFPEVLKKSILQMAVQGKLVPQDSSDEPASILLERIHAEKERLIKAGKIKRDKNESVIFRRDNSHYEKRNGVELCVDADIPYGIPDSWGWVRLSNVCRIVNGFTPLRSNPNYWENGTIPWFTVDDIHSQGRRIQETAQRITVNALGKDSNRILPPQTVLLCCTASVGEFAITEISLTTNQQFNGLVINEVWKDKYDPEFLLILVQTFKERLLTVAGKTTFNFISVKKLGSLVIPVLSIQEQKRIVSGVNKVMPLVATL